MNQGQEQYPELDATAPLMDGESPMNHTPLDRMRRQQLHDVARAWEIPVELDGTKKDILPMLKAAEGRGVFRQPPIHPEFAKRALRNSDDPRASHVVPGTMIPVDTKTPDYRSMDMTQLIEVCGAKGIDTERRGGDWMIKQLEASHAA